MLYRLFMLRRYLRHYQGKIAVITGAANGLGSALARELAARQCHLALIDIDGAGLEKLKVELQPTGVTVTAHCIDAGCEQAVGRAAGEIQDAHGAVHLLIHNAAISASASFSNTSSAEFERILRVNFFGAVNACRAFLPLLEKHGEGQILNVASCFAWLGYPGKTAYAASKGAIRAFSESLRHDLAAAGVGVTLLYPGPMRTSLVVSGTSDNAERLQREHQFLMRHGLDPERVARRCLDQLPRNPARIVIGLDYHLLDALARLSPALANRAMSLAASRAGF